MRPLKLTVQAFGPFQQRETIDFTHFGTQPLFLINGATGSGKTTLLDAMCFALYGQTTGSEREARQMRSDHADGSLLAEVDFTFALGNDTYRVLRQPDQERPKLRGEGTTPQAARADFWRIENDGHETALSTQKVGQANQAIEAKIGLNAAQFRQVIVLPQGQFRQLLLAGSTEREAIFSHLFQTHAYRLIEQRLQEHAGAIRKQVDDVLQRQEGILSTVGLEDEQQLQTELTTLNNAHAQALTHKQQCENKHRATLNYQREQQATNKLRQDAAHYAQEAGQARQALHKAEKHRQDTEDTLRPALETQQRRLIELENLRPHFQPLQAALDKTAALQQQQQQETRRLGQLQQNISKAEEQLAKQQQKLDTLHDNQQAIAGLELRLHQHEAYIRYLKQLTKQQAECAQLLQQQQAAQQQEQQSSKRHEQAQTACKQLELAWHQGQAILLAQALAQDEPCPVCGSTQHPTPAHGDLLPPSQQTLEQARQTMSAAADAFRQAELHCTRLNTSLQAAQQKLSDLQDDAPVVPMRHNTDVIRASNATTTPASEPATNPEPAQALPTLRTLQQAAQQLSITLQRYRQDAAALPELEKKLSEQQEHLTRQQTTHHEQQQTLQHTRNALARATAETELLQQQLPAAYPSEAALEQAIRQTQQTLSAQQKQLQQAETDRQQRQQTEQECEARLQAAQSQLTAAETTLAQARKQWQKTLHANQTITEIPEPDTTKLQDALHTTETALETALNEAEQQLQQLGNRLHQLQEADKKYQQNSKTQGKLYDAYKVAGTLADLANGRSHHRLSLQRFVLGVLLDDVLLAATSRFYQMSKGRYEMQRKATRSKGNRASGLDLIVTDTYTGKQRDVATLSGGESFMAALSLALGLSDVIQGYAGGIRLDTLFIDEGFGSLDEEALELAIRTLTELRDSGRMVGIISHVAELKQQIPQRLDVISGRDGSRVELHCG